MSVKVSSMCLCLGYLHKFYWTLDSNTSNKLSTPTESIGRSYSLSSSSQRPHSLESDVIDDRQKKQIDKESAHTLSWNDVSGECEIPGCQSKSPISQLTDIRVLFSFHDQFDIKTTGTQYPVIWVHTYESAISQICRISVSVRSHELNCRVRSQSFWFHNSIVFIISLLLPFANS